ncbi:MAG: FliM/FliN family flagellar motor switch protein [Spirochaetales bacterium]|nr:FliM/FliN family flagellar motor switch protein [Spirochaetales bacterium]
MIPMDKAHVKTEVVLGQHWMTLENLTKLKEGTIIELDTFAGEPVDYVVSGKTVAKGEVVVIDENFGIRITSILPPEKQ